MYIKRIILENFRNYHFLSWQPHDKINIIVGGNALGKTNLLEAIFFGLTGSSFRTSREKETVLWNASHSRVEIQLIWHDQQVTIRNTLTPGGKIERELNTRKLKKREQPVLPVIFTPDHLTLVKGSPRERRRWLDGELCLLYPGYDQYLKRYLQVVSQRNGLLQRIRERLAHIEELFPWDEQLAVYGARVTAVRLAMLSRLAPLFREIHSDISQSREKPGISYFSTLPLTGTEGEKEILGLFNSRLSSRHKEEVAHGQTLTGPHRDDLFFSINGYDARQYASQAQQRTIVLSLKLAQLELSYREKGEYPVLLLDDVLSELDRTRREQLLGRVHGLIQVFITSSTLPDIHEKNISSMIFTIAEGQIKSLP
ncbi:MAG TPA: DNA replication/repair protein RecF [Desulfotomaculum sp.]|nr:DNA replication/repair protein RecF [Desulfotomaculum sp.]